MYLFVFIDNELSERSRLQNMSFSHVTIIGAGWTGLTTAWQLQQAGVDTLVLELQPKVGGLTKTVSWEGFQFETGPQYFFSDERLVLDAMRELMGGSFQHQLKQQQVWFRDQWIPYPLNTRSILKIPMGTLIQATSEYIAHQLKHQFSPDRIRQTSPLQRGPEPKYGLILDQFLMSEHMKKLWQAPQPSLRPAWSSTDVEASHSTLDTLRKMLANIFGVPTLQTKTFHHPGQGIGSIAERMKEKVEMSGGLVRTSAKVRRVYAPDGEAKAVSYSLGGREYSQKTDYVFSTIPLASLLPLLEPLPPHYLIESSHQLRYRGLFFLNILLEQEEEAPPSFFYFPESKYSFFRASFAKPLQPYALSLQPLNCLTVEWVLEPDHHLYQSGPEAFLKECIPALEDAGLLKRFEVKRCGLHREPHVIPIYDEEHQRCLRQAQAYLTGIRRLRAVGRQGGFQNASLQQTIRMGFQAARSLIDETYARRPA